jgi:Calcineurin-like phosphoesterase superfamily domain
VTTAIVSDLHLGAGNDSDLLRREDARGALLEAIAGVERLVLLGDVIELRDRPLAEAFELSVPVLRELAGAAEELVLVPGNHDHRLVSGWLEQRALAGRRPLRLADRARLDVWPASALRKELGGVRLHLTYPGIWLRDDVYATHGHYLDRHLTIPTFERLGLGLVERTLGLAPALPDPLDAPSRPPEPDSPDDYERITGPIYAFLFALAQAGALSRHPGGTPSKRVWDALSGGEGTTGKIRGWLLGSVALPGAVGVANRLGLGPVRADLSPGAMTRAGVSAMGEVIDRLGIGARHVIFGHTHRRGPMPGEDEWGRGDGEVSLWNAGSWVHSPSLLGARAETSPYWPGTVAFVGAEGPPRLEHLLDGWTREDLEGRDG